MTNPSTLYRGGVLHCPADPGATAFLVSGGRIAWLGSDAEAPVADQVVDLGGALVTPAFVDAHVHTTDTGLGLSGLDVSGVRSGRELLAAVSAFAEGLPADGVVLGHGWDESAWSVPVPPGAAELGRAAAGRRVYLSQASMHSALVSTALLAACPGVVAAVGFDESGWLRRDAHHVVRAAAFESVGSVQRAAAQRAALAHAASLGVAAVHECGGPEISGEEDFTRLLGISGVGVPEVYGYWGELGGAQRARELGAVGAGGDVFADGALGAQTAQLTVPYADAGGCGHGYLSAEQVRDHLLGCARYGLQGGFHAIGDAAIATVLAGFAAVAARLGTDRVRAARHRVEHAELMDKRTIAGFVEYGVVASVQPAFDRLWGGAGRMYESRLGLDRSLAANPLGAMHSVGVSLAFGSDSPVTPVDPWGSVRAAVAHHNPAQRMSVRAAFAAHSRGGWRAVRRDGDGVLALGAPATFAVWDSPAGVERGLPVLQAEDPEARGVSDPTPLPVCLRTVLRGAVIYGEGGL